MSTERQGMVYIVGGGPGDPGLLTLRGRACLEHADLVVYDTLVHPGLLEHAPDAEHVFAGKRDNRHSLPQDDINRILINTAREGRCVVRLKGGDPFVFGRGGEEALALRAAGVPYEIVPGVTAGIAAPAYAGIPVTHRGTASSVTLVSGHSAEDGGLTFDIADLPKRGTLVFYMGVQRLPTIAVELIATGHDPATPAAVIEFGTYARQRTVTAPLDNIAAAAAEAGVQAPAILAVGQTVALRDSLAWFESRPLSGLRAAVTHSADADPTLQNQLRALGAEVLEFPTIAIEPVLPRQAETGPAPGFPDLSAFNWIIFSSVNAADAVFAEMERLGLDARKLARTHLCATADATAETLRKHFLSPDARPAGYGPEALIAELRAHPVAPLRSGSFIFLPRADIAPAALPAALREAGATVVEHVAYRAAAPGKGSAEIDQLLGFAPHLVLFTSPVAARNYSEVLGQARLDALQDCTYAAIGPVTTQAATEAGLAIAIEPKRYALRHLIEATCAWWAERRGGA